MADKHIKHTTAAQLTNVDRLQATRRAHEQTLLDKSGLQPQEIRDAAVTLNEHVFERLDKSAKLLSERDLAVSAERQDDDPSRKERDAASSALYSLMTRTRPTIEAVVGEEGKLRYGLEGETPVRPNALHLFASRVVELMEKEPGDFTDMFGNEIKTSNIVAMLKPACERLKTALDRVKQEDSELNAKLLERDRQGAEVARLIRAATLLQHALFVLADEEQLWSKEQLGS